MLTFYHYILSIIFLLNSPENRQTAGIVGQYQLRGVQETAAGFRFTADNKFEFFFSYGAADRYASGTYTENNGNIVLKGDKIPGKDFAITKSYTRGKGITLQVNNPNEILKKEIICVFYKDGQPELRYTDKNGICNYTDKADSIQLVHPLYPDEVTVFLTSTFTPEHNYFELSLEPSMEQLCFLQMPVEIKDDKFTCKLPWILGDKLLTFYKVGKN